jgi:hypothetical protein
VNDGMTTVMGGIFVSREQFTQIAPGAAPHSLPQLVVQA